MLRRALAASGALLVLFHVWLFAGQAWTGELADAALLGRWAVAGGLALALVWLRRQGLSLVRGRRAVAVWLLAALLHAPAVADRLDTTGPAVPEAVAVLAAVTVAALGTTLLLLIGLLRTGRDRRSNGWVASAITPVVRLRPASFLVLAPRPPPLR